jgi:hypothetical protein
MIANHSFLLKFERAKEHLHALELDAATWIESEPYRIIDEPDPDPPPYPVSNIGVSCRRFRVTRVDPVPKRFSLLIGDCVFNLRAALDHLALSLAKAFTPNITDRQIATSEFPIFHDEQMFKSVEERRIGCVAPPARKVIKLLQPYQRGDGYHSDPLWQLHELNRIDKHRTLTICMTVPIDSGERCVGFKVHKNMNIANLLYNVATVGDLKVNAVFFRYAVVAIDPNRDVYMEPVLPLEIVFGAGGPAEIEPVIPTLNILCDFIGKSVIAKLSQFL